MQANKTASYWNKQGGGILCRLCPHECLIPERAFGLCNARRNIKSNLVSQSYGMVSAINIEPMEKKPLYHFYPGLKTLSFGSFGCNLKCGFCQNHALAEARPSDNIKLSPKEAVYFALEKNVKFISYTYNEPLINYEWVGEMSALAKKKGMYNILVTNGYINEEPLKRLAGYIDAANVDLKAYEENFYERNCGGTLGPVLKTIVHLYKSKVHVELTNLVIDGENSDEENFYGMVEFIASMSDEIPLHLSRYFPNNKFTVARTKKETLLNLYNIAKTKLKHVYLGNFDSEKHQSTYCKSCGFCLIKRNGYNVEIDYVSPGICPKCATRNNITA